MKRAPSITMICVMMVLTASVLHAQAFVDKGFHPRMTALGRSVTAIGNDVSALPYNPAAIGFTRSAQVSAGFTELYPLVVDDNLNVMNAAASYGIDGLGAFGIAVSQFSPNFWSERTIIVAGATDQLFEHLSLGGSMKILSWSAEAPSGEFAVPEPAISFTGVSFDAGAVYQIPEIFEENDLNIGVALTDLLSPTISTAGSDDGIPLTMSAGVAFMSRKFNYSIFGGVSMKAGEMKVSFGYEQSAMKTSAYGVDAEFIVRVGGGRVTAADSQGEYNGGFGLVVNNVRVDYAYSYQAFLRNVGGISSIAIAYAF